MTSKLAKPSEPTILKVQIGMLKSEKANPLYSRVLTLRPFGAKPMSGQIIAKNAPKRIFPSDSRGELIAITKTDKRIASHGNFRKTRVSPLMVGQGKGYALPCWIIFIYAEAPRLILFAVIMLGGAGSHLTPRLHLPTDLKLMSANIVNIVSLNSCHSRIIRNDERRGLQVERCRNRMAYQKNKE